MTNNRGALTRRALCIDQNGKNPLYLFALTGREILEVADVSRVSRDEVGNLIGYQRPEVKRHVRDIAEYLNSPNVLFPNSIILALSSTVEFIGSRGPNVGDGLARSGTLTIPLHGPDGPKPAWLVDGQQRALALSMCNRPDLPVPISAFVADEIDLQRDQFLRINNTQPLPRGLVTELLPEMGAPLPPRLAAKKIPAALCDHLNTNSNSPFKGLIKRASTVKGEAPEAVIADASVVAILEESFASTSGCLSPYRNWATGETDFDGVWRVLTLFWSAVRDTFPDAWGKPPALSRLMHGAGLRAVGQLMDRVMVPLDVNSKDTPALVRSQLAQLAPHCCWTAGTWPELNLPWNEVQNTPKHIKMLSNYLIRLHMRLTHRGS